jgi:ureidoacrylate peracid hydrolase
MPFLPTFNRAKSTAAGETRPSMRRPWAGIILGGLAFFFTANLLAGDHDPAPSARLPARPGPIAIEPSRTAIIVVDMQNDFGAPGGLFDRMGIDRTEILKTVAPISSVLAAARHAGIMVIYLKMAFKPDLSDAGSLDSPNRIGHLAVGAGKTVRAPDGSESRILIRDTWNSEILPPLKPQPGDTVVYKSRFSGFYETELDAVLHAHGIRLLIFTGCTTSVCVESTLRDAMFHDYSCVLLADCTAEPLGADLAQSNYEATLRVVENRLGSVSTSADLLATLGSPAAAPTGQSR